MADSRELIAPGRAKPPLFVGVDIGGTNIKLGLVDDVGQTLWRTSIPTEESHGAQAAVERIQTAVSRGLAEAGLAWHEISRVGCGSPGPLDLSTGKLISPGNLPHWWQFPLRDALATATGRAVTFANDANAAAFGEFWIGKAWDWNSLVFYTLGTGVGGGIILEGNLVEGANSSGGELGHMIVDPRPDARTCSCGQRGHLEAYASATALVARTREAIVAVRESVLASKATTPSELTALTIDQAAEAGDPLANEMITETADYLALGIASTLHALDPQGVLLGGAMTFGGTATKTGAGFLGRVKSRVSELAFAESIRAVIIDYASLGGDAGYIGAAALARRDYYLADGDPSPPAPLPQGALPKNP